MRRKWKKKKRENDNNSLVAANRRSFKCDENHWRCSRKLLMKLKTFFSLGNFFFPVQAEILGVQKKKMERMSKTVMSPENRLLFSLPLQTWNLVFSHSLCVCSWTEFSCCSTFYIFCCTIVNRWIASENIFGYEKFLNFNLHIRTSIISIVFVEKMFSFFLTKENWL